MNVYDEDDQQFHLDMIMHDNLLQTMGKKEEMTGKEEEKKKGSSIPMRSRIKTKKGKKLILKKRKEAQLGKKKEREPNESKVYSCHHPMCEKVFLDRNSYRKHLITHGEKQFVCQADGCGKRFLDNSKLKRHMLVHTGEKPYKCELCNKRFSLDFNLRTHLRIHTGEKPYVCSFENCYKRFSQSSNLSAHEKTHYLPKEGESERKTSEDVTTIKRRIFKVVRPTVHVEKPKPMIILDRHRYIEKKIEEEKKKQEEKEAKELAKELAKENDSKVVSNNVIEKSNATNLNPSITSNIPINAPNPIKAKNVSHKELLLQQKEKATLSEIKTLMDKLSNNEQDFQKEVNEKDVLDKENINFANQMEYAIPYYLTREWVISNLI